MTRHISTAAVPVRAVLAGLITRKQSEVRVAEYLNELSFLAETAGAVPVRRFVQKLEHPDGRTFVGKGKLEEIRQFISDNDVDVIIFDDELSPSQFRNIEDVLRCRVLDRSNLILDIFAGRARTAYARTQVELAQYQYLLPRLTGLWSHLSKQRGGIGLRGPGEKEIETDRRTIRTKISLLKEKLKLIDRQKQTQRKSRSGLFRLALVGYTNVGKSTIMNLLSKSEMFAENKLFATLDTTVRKVSIDDTVFLLSDTVGFIRKLPHHLVESFKSTLDEVREADALLHVVDISHDNFEEHISVVRQTLLGLGIAEKPTLLIFNKTDLYQNPDDSGGPESALKRLGDTWMAAENLPCVFISATRQDNITDLRSMICGLVRERGI